MPSLVPVKDMLGFRAGKLLVIDRASKANDSEGNAMWLCKCDCGHEQVFKGTSLRSGERDHCEKCSLLLLTKKSLAVSENMIEKTFGNLTVISRAANTLSGTTRWNCLCTCGASLIVRGDSLRLGKSTHCRKCAYEISANKQRGSSRPALAKSKIDMTGQTLHNLTFLEYINKGKWRCKCNLCGNDQFQVQPCFVKNGNTKSCGCNKNTHKKGAVHSTRVDLIGKIFGDWTVVSYDKFEHKDGYWNCKCSCGVLKSIRARNLKDNETKSCGCKTSYYISINNGGTGIPREDMDYVAEVIRKCPEGVQWRKDCMARDNFTCQLTNIRGSQELHVHHKKPLSVIINENCITKDNYLDFKDVLFDLNNGITLSKDAHASFHKQYGLDAAEESLEEYLFD